MDSKEFIKIRHELGRTQDQMARVLCVSPKAIQSFEQGWRHVPSHIEREMLLLLSLKSSDTDRIPRPCWEVKNCPDEWRHSCIIWELKTGLFCWYLNGTFCQGQYHNTWSEKMELCRQCEVLQYTLPTLPDQPSIRLSVNHLHNKVKN